MVFYDQCLSLYMITLKFIYVLFLFQLPDVTETFDKLSDIIDKGSLKEQIQEGNKSFHKIEENIKKGIKDNIPSVRKSIADAGKP